MTKKYKAGQSMAFTPIPNPPKHTSGYLGRVDDNNGLFFEWDSEGVLKIVVRKDGVDYKQGMVEFIENCKSKSND